MALSKRKKIWLIVISAILITFIILILVANSILSNMAEDMAREQLAAMDSTSYVIDFEKIRVNIFSGSVKIIGITVKPDSAALEEVKRSRLAKPLVEVSISKIRIGSVDILKALKGKEFNIGSIRVDDPDITVYGPGGLFSGEKEKASADGGLSVDSMLGTTVIQAELGYFELENAHIRYIDASRDKVVLETKQLYIRLDDISLHHPDGDTTSNVLDIDDINLSLLSHMMDLPGNLYNLQTGKLEIGYKDRNINLDSLELIPAYSKERFGHVVGKQTDRFAVSVDHINISGIEFDSLLKKKIIIEDILLKRPYADIYRDKRIPRDMTIFPKLFQTAVADMPMDLFVKSVNISNAYVNYQEMVKGAAKPGMIMLDQMEISLTGICNYPDSIKKGQAITADIQAMLMGKSPVNFHFYLPIGNPKEYFTFYGSGDSFPATNLNPMMEPMAFVETTGGTVNSVNYYGVACCDTAIGRIEFKYQNLAVSVVKKQKEGESAIAENKFLSFMAKTVMHKNNPNKGKPVRIAKMLFVRDPNKGFFNYVWKTIQDGLIYSLAPGKKHLASYMSWPDFKARWEQNLWKDRQELNVKTKKKKK
ncbi:MAG: hypothetical protein KAH26_08260 [Bacteroidales bacterium]|nr:hypothetical protein [Bacteroidales bacterium]